MPVQLSRPSVGQYVLGPLLGARLSMNEGIRRAKKRRAQSKRLAKSEAKLLDLAAEQEREMLNPRRLSVLREVGAVLL